MIQKIINRTQKYYVENIARPFALLRIAVWTCFFLWLIAYFIPSGPFPLEKIPFQDKLDPNKIFSALTSKSTPKGFRDDIPIKQNDEFRIAWIGASSIQVNHSYDKEITKNGKRTVSYLPEYIAEEIKTANDGSPFVLMYLLHTARIFDKYMSVLHALQQEPDLIIVTVNPLWVYSNKSISTWTSLYPDVVRIMPLEIQSWAPFLMLASPVQLSEGIVSPYLQIIDDRFEYNISIKPILKITKSSTGLKAKNNMRDDTNMLSLNPTAFWLRAELGQRSLKRQDIQKAILRNYINTSEHTFNNAIMEQIIAALKDSDIPTLIYTAPLNPDLFNDPIIRKNIYAVNSKLVKVEEALKGENIDIWITNPEHSLESSDFLDFIHLKSSEKFAPDLLERIQTLLNRSISEMQGQTQ